MRRGLFVGLVLALVLLGIAAPASAKGGYPTRSACDDAAAANKVTDISGLGSALLKFTGRHLGEFPPRRSSEFPQTFPTDARGAAQTHQLYNDVLHDCVLKYHKAAYKRAIDVSAALAPVPTAPPATVPPPPTTAYVPPQVTYLVDGDGSASLTLQNPSGGTDQMTVSLPWTETFPAPPDGFVYVSAQQEGSGLVHCKITYGSTVIQEASSSGDYVIASCSGSV
jgi:hypothetical protein